MSMRPTVKPRRPTQTHTKPFWSRMNRNTTSIEKLYLSFRLNEIPYFYYFLSIWIFNNSISQISETKKEPIFRWALELLFKS